MGFPATPVLDSFTRADGAIGSNWSDLGSYGHPWTISSNAILEPSTSGVDGGNSWNVSTYGPDCEVYATETVIVTGLTNQDSVGFELRLSATTGNRNGYHFDFPGTGGATAAGIYRLDSNAFTQLGATFSYTPTAGHVYGGSAVGSTLTMYDNGTSIASRSDSTYSNSGYLGIHCFTEAGGTHVGKLDDFGGGTVFPSVTTLLDDFNRGSIGSTWTTPTYGDFDLQVNANALVEHPGSFSAGYLNTISVGPAFEFWVDAINFSNGAFAGFMYCLNSGGSDAAPNGYEVNLNAGTGNGGLDRVDAGANTSIGTFTLNASPFSVGDKFGVRVLADGTHLVYYYTGGSWSLIYTGHEATYTSGGFLGFELQGGFDVDNMYGGTYGSASFSGSLSVARTEGFSSSYDYFHPVGVFDYSKFPKTVMRNRGR